MLIESTKPEIRELTLRNGLSYPSDEELLMLILGTGTKYDCIEKLSEKVLKVIDSSNQENLVQNLTQVKGMGTARTLALAAAIELGRRRSTFRTARISNPAQVLPYITHYTLSPVERFITVSLNGSKEILNIRVISMGTINRTMVHPREVFADPVAEHASAIICVHNHPSGPSLPSSDDKTCTKILKEASTVLGVCLLDHIIVSKTGYFSFLENGLL